MKKLILFLVLVIAGVAHPFYEPFPIFNMKAGMVSETEPWLLPKDGFVTLSNCHLRRGVLEKRRGYTLFGQMCHIATDSKDPTLKTDPVMGIFNYYSGATEQLMAMDCNRVCAYITSAVTGKSITQYTNAGGGLVEATSTTHGFSDYDIITISGTTNYDGTYRVQNKAASTFQFTDTFVADDATGTVSQEPFLDLTTSKIRFKDGGVQVHTLIVGDTLTGANSGSTATIRAITVDTGTWAGNTADGTIHLSTAINASDQSAAFQDENITDGANVCGHIYGDSSDEEFTGGNTNFFWVENWKNVAYITNDNDVIQKYDGTTLTRLHIDLDVEGGPDNDVTRCKLIFATKGRLVIFDVTERGTTYRQRARWCEVNDPKTWVDANFNDADTEDWIIGADFIGKDLYVWFERSIWKLSYTADPDQPFRWDKAVDTEGCYATMSLVSFSDEIIGVGPTRLIGFDRRKAYGIDDKIPDFMLTWNQDSIAYSYGLVLEEEGQAWISYTSQDASANADGNVYPDRAVVLNYEDSCFSTYEIPIHTLGYSSLQTDLLWDDITDDWDDCDWSFDEKSLQGGYPTTLMGSQNGKLYQLNDGGDDDGAAIEFEAVTGRWNPYIQEGKQARLGWIDFLVDVDASVTFDVVSYINNVLNPLQTKTVTCTALEGGASKTWHRVYVNATARSHQIKITNNATLNRPRIHCIMPWFEKAGNLF